MESDQKVCSGWQKYSQLLLLNPQSALGTPTEPPPACSGQVVLTPNCSILCADYIYNPHFADQCKPIRFHVLPQESYFNECVGIFSLKKANKINASGSDLLCFLSHVGHILKL